MTTEPTGLPEILMDSAQLGIWVITAGGIIGGLFKGIAEIKNNTKVREEELRWRRADRAATELSRVLNSQQIKAVLAVLDVDGQTLVTRNSGPVVIQHSEIPHYFRIVEPGQDGSVVVFGEGDASEDIRNEFDALFERLEHLESLIDNGVICAKDVMPPITYWMKKILVHPPLMNYLEAYEFELAKRFVERFKDAPS